MEEPAPAADAPTEAPAEAPAAEESAPATEASLPADDAAPLPSAPAEAVVIAPSPVPVAPRDQPWAADGADEQGWGGDEDGAADGGLFAPAPAPDDGDIAAAARTAAAASTGARGFVSVPGATTAVAAVEAVFFPLAKAHAESVIRAKYAALPKELQALNESEMLVELAALDDNTDLAVPVADAMRALYTDQDVARYLDAPVRRRVEGDRATSEEEAGDDSTLRTALKEAESSGAETITLSELLSYMGLGGPAAHVSAARMRAMEEAASGGDSFLSSGSPAPSDEEGMLRDLQEEISRMGLNAAKLMVVAGLGASRAGRSVYRVWPKLWDSHTRALQLYGERVRQWSDSGSSPPAPICPSERQMFEIAKAHDFVLNDIRVLDVGSLHWSEPVSADGTLPPCRAGHALVTVPTRIHALPKLRGDPLAYELPGTPVLGTELISEDDDSQLYGERARTLFAEDVPVVSLLEHIDAMADIREADGSQSRTAGVHNVGRAQIEALCQCLSAAEEHSAAAARAALEADPTDALAQKLATRKGVSDIVIREVLGVLCAPTSQEANKAAPFGCEPANPKLLFPSRLSILRNVNTQRDGAPYGPENKRSILALRHVLLKEQGCVERFPSQLRAAVNLAKTARADGSAISIRVVNCSMPSGEDAEDAPEDFDRAWVEWHMECDAALKGEGPHVQRKKFLPDDAPRTAKFLSETSAGASAAPPAPMAEASEGTLNRVESYLESVPVYEGEEAEAIAALQSAAATAPGAPPPPPMQARARARLAKPVELTTQIGFGSTLDFGFVETGSGTSGELAAQRLAVRRAFANMVTNAGSDGVVFKLMAHRHVNLDEKTEEDEDSGESQPASPEPQESKKPDSRKSARGALSSEPVFEPDQPATKFSLQETVAPQEELVRKEKPKKHAIAEVGRAVLRLSQLCHVPESNDSDVQFKLPLVGGGRGGFVTVSVNASRAFRTLFKAKRRAWVDAFKAYVIGGMEPVDVLGRAIEPSTDAPGTLSRVPSRLFSSAAENATVCFDAASATWGSVGISDVDAKTYMSLDPVFRAPPEMAAQTLVEMERMSAMKYASPGPRVGHATWTCGAHVFVCGGLRPNDVAIMDVCCLDTTTNTWVELTVASPPEETPTPRHGHAAVSLPAFSADVGVGAAVVCCGLTSDGTCATDVYLCVCKPLERTIVWRRIFPLGRAPQGRAYLAMAAVREAVGSYSVYQFGGRSKGTGGDSDALDGELRCLTIEAVGAADLVTAPVRAEWLQLSQRGRMPAARECCALQAVGRRLLLSGGWLGVERAPWARDFWVLDLRRMFWTGLAFSGLAPSARYLAGSAVVDYRESHINNAQVLDPEAGLYPPSPAGGLVGAPPAPGKQAHASVPVVCIAGKRRRLLVNARDLHGLPVGRGGDFLQATLRAPSAGEASHTAIVRNTWSEETCVSHVECAVRNLPGQPGTYEIAFTPFRAGVFGLVVVGENGDVVEGGYVPVLVYPASAAPARFAPHGRGLAVAPPGESTTVRVKPRDAYGNDICFGGNTGGGGGIAQLRWPEGKADSVPPRVTATVLYSGKLKKDQPDQGKRRKKKNRKAYGAGDDDGIDQHLQLKEVPPVPVSVTYDPEEGYQLSFAPTEAGMYELRVFSDDAALAGVPYVLESYAMTVDPAKSYLRGRCVNGRWHAGIPFEFTIHACDRYGNHLDVGGHPFEVEVRSKKSGALLDAAIVDNKDGTYSVSSNNKIGGALRVSVFGKSTDPSVDERKDGKGMANTLNSPFNIEVTSGLLNAAKSTVEHPSFDAESHAFTESVRAGETLEFFVVARDGTGRTLNGGNDILELYLDEGGFGEVITTGTVEDMMDGNYKCTVVPRFGTIPAAHSILKVMARDGFSDGSEFLPITGSDIMLSIEPGKIEPQKCVAVGPGVDIANATVAREPSTFVVKLRDTFGNGIGRGGDEVTVSVVANETLGSLVSDKEDGTYEVSYTAGNAADYRGRTVYKIFVEVNGSQIYGSPFYHSVSPARTDPLMCDVIGLPALLTAGETAEFLVQAKDIYGRPQLRGGDDFQLIIGGAPARQMPGADKNSRAKIDEEELQRLVGNCFGDVRDLKNGQYLCRVLAEERAYFRVELQVCLNDVAVKSMPAVLPVVPTGLFNHGFWSRTKLVDERVADTFALGGVGIVGGVAGETLTIDVLSKSLDDAFPAEEFTVELRGPEFVAGIVEGPFDGGIYRASYAVTTSGAYIGTIKLGRFPLAGCPFRLEIRPAETHPEHVEVRGKGVSEVVAQENASFTLVSKDQFGNNTYRQEDVWRVRVKGGGKVGAGRHAKFQKVELDGTATAMGDGTVVCEYTVPIEGYYSVSVQQARSFDARVEEDEWQDIRGSPFSVQALKPKVEMSDEARQKILGMGAQNAASSLAEMAAKQAGGGAAAAARRRAAAPASAAASSAGKSAGSAQRPAVKPRKKFGLMAMFGTPQEREEAARAAEEEAARLLEEAQMDAEEAERKEREAEDKRKRREAMLKKAETGPFFAYGFWKKKPKPQPTVTTEEETAAAAAGGSSHSTA